MPWFEEYDGFQGPLVGEEMVNAYRHFNTVTKPAYLIVGILLLLTSSVVVGRRVNMIYNFVFHNRNGGTGRNGEPDSDQPQPPWYELVEEYAVESEEEEENDNWLL
ncbi:hypothetical protein H0G86_011540 [Trichoderma simmonsii]|uniref:Uncharacterized protein n=1 Tax=Trichoderma simmonsii TaxID=1491479 RepID=A0A8G0LPK2_9HYPO|nr:hypothetical protein H0G86_011540 [Trichoderma simmonsii]